MEKKKMYKQGQKIIYEKGDKIGPYNIVFLQELDLRKKHRYGLFICPKCNRPIMKAKISTVKSGYSKQCFECRNKQNLEHCKQMQENRKIDLTGQVFGKLTALYPIEEQGPNHATFWMCQCSCESKTIIPVALNHLRTGHTTSCGCIQSKGEEKVGKILSELNIKYKKQYKFSNCTNPSTNKQLPFDFYLPEYNCCIEYDGEQHFGQNFRGWFTKDVQKEIQHRDSIKNNFCQENKIKLIRIPYYDLDKIDKQYLLHKIGGEEEE